MLNNLCDYLYVSDVDFAVVFTLLINSQSAKVYTVFVNFGRSPDRNGDSEEDTGTDCVFCGNHCVRWCHVWVAFSGICPTGEKSLDIITMLGAVMCKTYK